MAGRAIQRRGGRATLANAALLAALMASFPADAKQAAPSAAPVFLVTVHVTPKAAATLASRGHVVTLETSWDGPDEPIAQERVQLSATGGVARFYGKDTASGRSIVRRLSSGADVLVNAFSRPDGRPFAEVSNLISCGTVEEPWPRPSGETYAISCKLIGE